MWVWTLNHLILYVYFGLFAVVADAIRSVDLANDGPVVLMTNADKAIRFREFLFEHGVHVKIKGPEGIFDLCNQFWVQVVRVTVSGCRKRW